MKTVEQWLNMLEEPYKTKAINYTDNDILQSEENSIQDSLNCAFDWEATKEGYDYWDNLYIELSENAGL